MPTARPLSTTELGEIRYNQAITSNLWPIQVSIIPPSFDPPSIQYTLVVPGLPTTPFLETCHRDIRATVAVPPGTHTYTIYRDHQRLSSHSIQVQSGQVPIGTTKLASKLKEHQPSGVTQISDSVNGTATVRFVYAEETYSVREAYAIGDGLNLKLHRETSGDFVGETNLQLGTKDIRFRIIPREWTRPNVAAFTRLGWDDAAGEHGELVTWPLQAQVTQFRNQFREEVGGRTDADTVTSSNKYTPADLEEQVSETQSRLNGKEEGDGRKGVDTVSSSNKSTPADREEQVSEAQSRLNEHLARSDAREEQKDDCDSCGGFGVVITGIAALLAGLALTVLLGRENESVEDEDIQKPGTGVLVGKDSSSSDVLKHMRSSSI